MAEFDAFADSYRDIIDRSLRPFGFETTYFARYKARYIYDHVVSQAPEKILDFGCGVGLLAPYLKTCFPTSKVHGFDSSGSSIAAARRNFTPVGHFTSDPYELDSDYSLILLSNVLHHVGSHERKGILDGLWKRLDKSGRIVVFEQNPVNPFTRWVFSRNPLDANASLLKLRRVRRLLDRSGFECLRQDYIVFFPSFLRRLIHIEKLLFRCPLGAQYTLVGKKK